MNTLHDDQVAAFRRDGFLFPFAMLGKNEIQTCLAALGRFEERLGCPLPRADRKWNTMAHAHLPWFNELVRDPRILDVIEDLIGPDILVWTSTFWIKEPGSPAFAAWHQDNAYFGLLPSEQVCAWLALSDADGQSGCMEVLSWRGAPRLLHHAPNQYSDSINRGSQTVVEPFDASQPETMALKAGSFSIHHGLCLHYSGPNWAAHRRIGLGFNYMPAHVRVDGPVRMAAMLVRGQDKWGHFDLIEPPVTESDPDSLALHEDIYARYGANYREQIARHEREFTASE